MKIWLITGAQAGVGKTTLLRGLTKILPDTVCVKLGHGLRKTTGLKNYFTQTEDALEFIDAQQVNHGHCIVESNRLVGKIDADIIIFLDTLNGERRRDADQLRSAAQIVLDKKVRERDWEKPLRKLDLSEKERTGVLKVFQDQKDYLSSSRLILRTKLWFSRDGLLVFGEGLGRLLLGIEAKGSLSAAAKEEGISYRHAWGDIKRAEERLGFPLVTSSPGGVEGGGSMLTEKGKLLMKGYEEIKRKVFKNSDKYFRELLDQIEDAV